MIYEKKPLMDSDSRLIKFTDRDSDGDVQYDTAVYVRFKYDLSEDQVDSITEAAGDCEYYDFDSFDEWVEAVIKKAMEHECWKHDSDNGWEFWYPDPCLEVEV